MVEYLAHLLLRIDKPVAADGQSRLDTRYLQRLIYQRLRSLKAGGHPEHLAVGRIVSAIDVVEAQDEAATASITSTDVLAPPAQPLDTIRSG